MPRCRAPNRTAVETPIELATEAPTPFAVPTPAAVPTALTSNPPPVYAVLDHVREGAQIIVRPIKITHGHGLSLRRRAPGRATSGRQWRSMHLRSQTRMTTANEQERLEDLNKRAGKLGYQIEPSVTKLGYCLWRSWPGIGRQMILGRDGDVALDAIAQKLDKIEAEAGPKKSGR